MPISAFMIALNEELAIAKTLESLRWADEIVIVDSGSTDKTAEIGKKMGAKLFKRPFDNFANQKNFALSLTSHDWVFSIDADEIVSAELLREIQHALNDPDPDIAGYRIMRRNYFLGKPLKFGGQGIEPVLRLFKKNSGKFVGAVHEEISVKGKKHNLNGILEHKSIENLNDYFQKFHLYTDLEARRTIHENKIPSFFAGFFLPPCKWIINYLFKAGFLDGWRGLLYHSLSCYYGWVKYLKAKSYKNENWN